MNAQSPPTAWNSIVLGGGIRSALELLGEAYACAWGLGRRPWDFAVEIDSLWRSGLTNSGLRWLLCQGYAEHAREVGDRGADERCFERLGLLTITGRTCVVLTPAGVELARRLVGGARGSRHAEAVPRSAARAGRVPILPAWDEGCRELWLGAALVKRFRQPAGSQETILAAFEEDGWPPRIDDPLPGRLGIDPKQRLHDTIKNINRGQANRLILFRGDGTGCGVCWGVRA
jgi:hypothetical protein